MDVKSFWKKRQNHILAAGLVAVLAVFAALRYDYYFDLNDDVLMKDILAGVYTGEPESLNIQMLFPISALISLLYRLAPGAAWYGLFLCVCHYGSLYLIADRSLVLLERGGAAGRRASLAGKLTLLAAEGLMMAALFLQHLVFAQYTVTCTLLAAAAALSFLASDSGCGPAGFVRKNGLAVGLVMIAYFIRTEMLLLALPMVCVAGIWKWSGERKVFTAANARKYFSLFGTMLIGLALGQLLHGIACSGPEWTEFNELFDNRTELYDFQAASSYAYEGNEEFFRQAGLTRSEAELLQNYNFGLSEEIDADLLGKTAEYAAAHRPDGGILAGLGDSLYIYRYRLAHKLDEAGRLNQDYPYNWVTLLLYAAVFVLGLIAERGVPGERDFSRAKIFWRAFWRPALLASVRTGLWMFILLRQRYPERITHSLYLMEIVLLLWLLLDILRRRERSVDRRFAAAVFLLAALLLVPGRVRRTDEEYARREEINRPYLQMQEYCRAHPRSFYFLDVYSTVAYSEKMFRDVDNRLANYDLMGGWASKSPLEEKKLRAFGLEEMEGALLLPEGVYLMAEPEADLGWLAQYYADQGREVEIRLVDEASAGFRVYQVAEPDAGREAAGEGVTP